MSGSPDLEKGAGRLPPNATLLDHARFFFRLPTPRVMLVTLVALAVLRMAVRDFSVVDLWLVLGLVAVYPFVEWFAHRVVLHWQPRTFAGRTIDLGPAINHRTHHGAPNDLAKNVPDTTRNLLIVLVGAAVPTFVVFHDAGPRVTVLVYTAAALAAYEWTHYLLHSTFRPKGKVFRKLQRNHMLHHYRNENYWFGIVTYLADVVLRTDPAAETIPRSATTRNLGVIPD